MKVTTEMVQRALSVFKGRRMVDPPWQESEAAMRAALEAVLTDVPEPEEEVKHAHPPDLGPGYWSWKEELKRRLKEDP